MIAGTLCLMSCYAQHASPAYARRIADNLLRLAAVVTLTAEFRAVCRRMADRWSALEHEALRRSADGAPIPDARTLQ
jgi:hypothetical protein